MQLKIGTKKQNEPSHFLRNVVCGIAIAVFVACLLVRAEEFDGVRSNAQQTVLPSFPVSGNSIIEPLEGETLQEIVEQPAMLDADHLVLRRRFSASQYGLYQGKKGSLADERLCAFQPPAAVSFFFSKRLYRQKTDNPNLDIANVYFDNDFIYVENTAKIYYYDKGWQSLSMLQQQTHEVTITSEPNQATVLINGCEAGMTPLHLRELRDEFIMLTLHKEGFYRTDRFVRLSDRSSEALEVCLTPVIEAPAGTYIDPQTYTSEDPNSVQTLMSAIDEAFVQQKLVQTTTRNLLFGKETETFHTAAFQQLEFEKSNLYQQRQQLLRQQLLTEQVLRAASLSRVAENAATDVRALSKPIRTLVQLLKHKAVLDNRLYSHFLTADCVTLQTYNPDQEHFPVVVTVNRDGYRLAFQGLVRVPLSYAADFKRSFDQGLLKLTYKNEIFPDPKNPSQYKTYYKYTTLSILFKGGEYPLETGRQSLKKTDFSSF